MAKKRGAQEGSKRSRGVDRHAGRRLVVYVDQADYDLLQRHISKQAVEVKMSACVRRGIRLFLQSVGELPAA